MRWLPSILAVLLVVPRYAGDERLPTIGDFPVVRAEPYVPKGGWPQRIGALVPVGGVTLHSYDAAFGGFSALAIREGRALLLNDGGNVLSLALRKGTVVDPRGHVLPDGPGIGWHRRDRDSESLALDPTTGTVWVSFETDNEIWRYSPDLTRPAGQARPEEMRNWEVNQGAESLVRLRDGRFVAIAERKPDRRTRHMLLFSGDPIDSRTRVTPLRLRVPLRYHPSDAAELPNGDLLVLLRRFQYPFRFTAKLLRVPRAALRRGADVEGQVIATLAPPIIGENAEGLTVTREGKRTMLWIVTDNDGMPWRPTYLLKFALAD
ncbi:esterase-like activity of phytase family protein [Sphingomonas jeddahensis]|uniref:Phytase-like domain-containing protein n=1 Tax=Sphingomonas jeddahensis TaxID=1915074 RepID=A0A1V2EV96_9SPHN|nr:esterase-like activity of phytase family protein [Sphingomonas jeddahensis]ONF96520.1 hypothetical protein SPHI_13050 [Sphingomonas jeddahensis]